MPQNCRHTNLPPPPRIPTVKQVQGLLTESLRRTRLLRQLLKVAERAEENEQFSRGDHGRVEG